MSFTPIPENSAATPGLWNSRFQEIEDSHNLQSLSTSLLFSSDNTYDIGTASSGRPRTGYFGTSVISPLLSGPVGQTTIVGIPSGGQLSIQVNGGAQLITVTTAGRLRWTSDNSEDIGASGANRPRSIYAATSVNAPTISASTTVSASSSLSSPVLEIVGSTALPSDVRGVGASTATTKNVALQALAGSYIGFKVGGNLVATIDETDGLSIINPLKLTFAAGASQIVMPGAGQLLIGGAGSIGNNGVQVISVRQTGWLSPTGTANRATFATSSVTLEGLAQRVKALIDDLMTHGLIGN